MKLLRTAFHILLPLTAVLMLITLWYVFMVVPSERMMGAVQRIFYFHVGSALSAYAAIGIVFLSSIGYLARRSPLLDAVNGAAGEVGFMLCTLVLATGMIWGHAAWNTWFSWEPRLISFLLLWLIFFGFVVLRKYGEPAIKGNAIKGNHCAVLGIVGALTVPIVVFSIKFLPAASQLHPQVVAEGGLTHPSYKTALILAILSMVALQTLLVVMRVRMELLRERLEELG